MSLPTAFFGSIFLSVSPFYITLLFFFIVLSVLALLQVKQEISIIKVEHWYIYELGSSHLFIIYNLYVRQISFLFRIFLVSFKAYENVKKIVSFLAITANLSNQTRIFSRILSIYESCVIIFLFMRFFDNS